MTNTNEVVVRPPLRLWPGVIGAALIVLMKYVVPAVVPEAAALGVIGGAVGAVLVLLWWVLFSRAPWIERVGAILVTIAAYFAVKPFLHESISGGLMGNMFAVYAIPSILPIVFVAWAVLTRHLSNGVRRATMVATIVLACASWTLIRTDGVQGDAVATLHWRWTPTAEDRLLARGDDAPAAAAVPTTTPANTAPAPAPAVTTKESPDVTASATATKTSKPTDTADKKPAFGAPAATRSAGPATSAPRVRRVEWPGFRGAERDNVVHGVGVKTDWATSPPIELWRRPIGPGWSSFAVDGDRIYTQEQRGEEEIVSSYRLSNGAPIWRHRDSVRFYESNGGAGPRATPTLHNGRVYTLGATGILNALDAANGAVVWSRNASSDTGAKLPGWGFTGSPLVVDDLLIVATSGRLAGYELATGQPRWTRMTGGGGYSSPHFVTIDGVPQVVLLHGNGATGVAPADGAVLWAYEWKSGVAIVQPAVVNGDLIVALGDMMGGTGIRRIAVSRAAGSWKVEERWNSRGLKPYFNDFVVHKGDAYGFDGSILACIDLTTGERKWKGGRYGQGQLVLLADQDVLLVLSEEGELALVSATHDEFKELARFKAIEGKTWNHPVLIRDVLLVRNGEEMAAFRLPRVGTS